MDYEVLSEKSLDEIMRAIRTANGTVHVPAPVSYCGPYDGIKRNAELEGIENLIQEASAGSEIGLHRQQMSRMRGLKRWLAKAVERVYMRVAELTNRDLRSFCTSAVSIFRGLCGKIEELFFNDQKLDNRLSTLEHAVEEQEKTIRRMEQIAEDQQTIIRCMEQRNSMLQAGLEKRLDVLYSDRPSFDESFYHDLEEEFRGPQDEIRQRLEFYREIIFSHFTSLAGLKMIDLGCGRGEFLDLLRECGADGRIGVDINSIQAELCRQKGHYVVNEDCFTYLASLKDDSVDAISAIQLIEHLSFNKLQLLFSECHRVLKTGGILLLESPNCENIITATRYFYIDPSHNRPVNPEYARFMAIRNGFEKADIMYLNHPEYVQKLDKPADADAASDFAGRNAELLNGLLFGPQDFALVAEKGA